MQRLTARASSSAPSWLRLRRFSSYIAPAWLRRHSPSSSSTFRLNLVRFYYKSTRNDARFRVGFRNGRCAFGAKFALWRHQSAKDADVNQDHEEAEGGLGEERGRTRVARRGTRGRRKNKRTHAGLGLFARFALWRHPSERTRTRTRTTSRATTRTRKSHRWTWERTGTRSATTEEEDDSKDEE